MGEQISPPAPAASAPGQIWWLHLILAQHWSLIIHYYCSFSHSVDIFSLASVSNMLTSPTPQSALFQCCKNIPKAGWGCTDRPRLFQKQPLGPAWGIPISIVLIPQFPFSLQGWSQALFGSSAVNSLHLFSVNTAICCHCREDCCVQELMFLIRKPQNLSQNLYEPLTEPLTEPPWIWICGFPFLPIPRAFFRFSLYTGLFGVTSAAALQPCLAPVCFHS